jgi:hypothetical protein
MPSAGAVSTHVRWYRMHQLRPRTLALIAGTVLSFAAMPASAPADEVDPNFLSKLEAVRPSVKGLQAKLLLRGDEIVVQNRTGKVLVVTGYGDEPYLRFLPSGIVEENQNSPAKYLNADRYATQKVPDFADTDAKPRWKAIEHGGEYEWHDHRIHYMGRDTPRQVEDESKRQKVFDWKVKMALGDEPVVASGTLFWIPTAAAAGDDDGGSGLAIVLIVVALLALVTGIGLVLRRRVTRVATAGGTAPDGAPPRAEPESPPKRESPPKPDKEAW